MTFLDNLNEKQRQAVTAARQSILVLAGPGTGKTRTLIARILYLIEHYRVDAYHIMAVTFTNKAKEEMRTRLRQELGDLADDVSIGTFHHYCLDVLRTYHHEAHLPKQFAIADETSQLMALSRISRIGDERSLRTVLNAISSYRLNKHNLNPNFQAIAEHWIEPYQEELRKNNLIDFDQIILRVQTLFEKHSELVEAQQHRFTAVLIDEFQDTDPVQYGIIKSLVQRHRNIFAVADDDQSIFAWRGAHVGNIQRYIKDFDCQDRVIVLDRNYRSAQGIIDVASQLLHEHRLIDKGLHAVTDEQNDDTLPKPQFLNFADDEEETDWIIEQINAFVETGVRYADIAVLFPNHAIGEQLETRMLAANIPCQLVKRQGVFDHDDVQKLILLVKLLQNPDDDVALEQFFQRELNNDLVFQQIRPLKTTDRSFKHTLYAAAKTHLSGISQGQFWKIVSTCFGTISNLLSYVDHNPEAELDELMNVIWNTMQPEQASTIHNKGHELRDPLDIPGIIEAVDLIVSTIDEGGTIALVGVSAQMCEICCELLKASPTMAEHIDSSTSPSPDLLLCLDMESASSLDERPALVFRKIRHEQKGEALVQERPGGGLVICSSFSPVFMVFKLLQALKTYDLPKPFREYVVLDLETTSADTRTTGIVEIGAVKVRDGEIIERLGRLVNPEKPITQGAYKVHGISDNDVREQPTFKTLLPEFLEFIGDDLLVAHNGFEFDFPILWRAYREATGGKLLPNRRFDTLPLARRLFPGQKNSVDGLMQRFNIRDVGGRHRALDDTVYLTPIFERLQEIEQSLNRRTEYENLLDVLALGLFLDGMVPSADDAFALSLTTEECLLFQLGAGKLLSRFSELSETLRELFVRHQELIQRSFEANANREVDEHHHALRIFNGKEAAIARLKELASAFSGENLRERIQRFLDHATLYSTQDDICQVNAVNLLTIHSSKGLEFPIVFVCGVEKGNLPSFYSVREEGELREKKLDEQRRLFYVAMTRAKYKLFVTYVNKRGDYPKKRSQFLIELGIELQEEVL
ncbi:hypothetical protein CSA56_12465 [candidate division KSB3 bacterium]|uniref:DNA 3'-5' helicase n=1 Tax=candidate division KSB3 bacterium TaxID=2044937 RepID=A0A2G6KCB2_9BACT|nr:MAG: hypothetical protein CSA56_12465 [candidate division KSB3 bacterium]